MDGTITPSTICLFLPSGKTFTFRGCHIEIDNEDMLRFTYQASSDSRQGYVMVQKSQIVAFSQKG